MGDNDIGNAIWNAPGQLEQGMEDTFANNPKKAQDAVDSANQAIADQVKLNQQNAQGEKAQLDKYNKAFDQSMGANAGESLQRADASASPLAQQQAMQQASNQLAVGRGAGLNKGQASLQAGQQVGNTFTGAKQQATSNYFNSANMFGNQANQAGNRNLAYGTDWGGQGLASGNANRQQGRADEQYKAGMDTIRNLTAAGASFIPGAGTALSQAIKAEHGTTEGEGLTHVGEAGEELAILAPGSIVIPHDDTVKIKEQKTDDDKTMAIKLAIAKLKKAGR